MIMNHEYFAIFDCFSHSHSFPANRASQRARSRRRVGRSGPLGTSGPCVSSFECRRGSGVDCDEGLARSRRDWRHGRGGFRALSVLVGHDTGLMAKKGFAARPVARLMLGRSGTPPLARALARGARGRAAGGPRWGGLPRCSVAALPPRSSPRAPRRPSAPAPSVRGPRPAQILSNFDRCWGPQKLKKIDKSLGECEYGYGQSLSHIRRNVTLSSGEVEEAF